MLSNLPTGIVLAIILSNVKSIPNAKDAECKSDIIIFKFVNEYGYMELRYMLKVTEPYMQNSYFWGYKLGERKRTN